jgi:hypothetical protein
MRPRLKGRTLSPSFGRDIASLAENSKELLRCCLSSIHDLTRRYYYRISAEESIPSSLSYLLSTREVDILEIFKICGFYNEKRGAFLFRVFETWVAASFDTRTVEVTTYCFPESPHKHTTDQDWCWGAPLPPKSSTERKAGPSKISNADGSERAIEQR